jgi:sugar phosphate isomerase/epimerase
MKTHRYGIFSWYGYRAPIAERMARIRAAGFSSTMLWWGDELAFGEHCPRELVELTRENDLFIENIHVPFGQANGLWSSDRDVRDSIVEQHRAWIREASEYGIPVMVMHAASGKSIEAPNPYGLLAVESLVREAEKRNVVIALENTSATYLLQFVIRSIDSTSLRVCYDTSHAQLSGVANFDLMKELRDRISCFHISDNDGLEDRHWNIGQGTIDWDGFAEAFPKEYEGTLSVEVLPKDSEIEESKFLSNAFDGLAELGRKIAMARMGKDYGN